jgi:hypothetical protein
MSALLDKNANVRHGIPVRRSNLIRRNGDQFGRHQANEPGGDRKGLLACFGSAGGDADERRTGRQSIGDFMSRYLSTFRHVAMRCVAVPGAALLIGIGAAIAQSGDLRAQDQSKQQQQQPNAAEAAAAAARDSKRKAAEFVEAAQAINGPAGNPECVWLGRRVVGLMWRDDLDTAFRHLDLYDRFGCPGGHVQAAFRCLVRFGGTIDNKVAESLNSRVHACWINPGAQPEAAAATPPAPPPAAPQPQQGGAAPTPPAK